MDNVKYCASAFVLNKDNKILLIWHKKFNKFIQPGGHLNIGEEPIDAAIREVLEETHIHINIFDKKPLWVEDYHNNVGHQIDYQFLAFAMDESIRKNDESFKAGWYSLEDLDHIEVVDDLKEKVRFILENVSYREDLWKKELLLEKS